MVWDAYQTAYYDAEFEERFDKIKKKYESEGGGRNMSKVKTCAFARANKCSALTNKFCKECSFFKTAEELEKSRKETEKRITSLPRLIQMEIRSKYYAKR